MDYNCFVSQSMIRVRELFSLARKSTNKPYVPKSQKRMAGRIKTLLFKNKDRFNRSTNFLDELGGDISPFLYYLNEKAKKDVTRIIKILLRTQKANGSMEENIPKKVQKKLKPFLSFNEQCVLASHYNILSPLVGDDISSFIIELSGNFRIYNIHPQTKTFMSSIEWILSKINYEEIVFCNMCLEERNSCLLSFCNDSPLLKKIINKCVDRCCSDDYKNIPLLNTEISSFGLKAAINSFIWRLSEFFSDIFHNSSYITINNNIEIAQLINEWHQKSIKLNNVCYFCVSKMEDKLDNLQYEPLTN